MQVVRVHSRYQRQTPRQGTQRLVSNGRLIYKLQKDYGKKSGIKNQSQKVAPTWRSRALYICCYQTKKRLPHTRTCNDILYSAVPTPCIAWRFERTTSLSNGPAHSPLPVLFSTSDIFLPIQTALPSGRQRARPSQASYMPSLEDKYEYRYAGLHVLVVMDSSSSKIRSMQARWLASCSPGGIDDPKRKRALKRQQSRPFRHQKDLRASCPCRLGPDRTRAERWPGSLLDARGGGFNCFNLRLPSLTSTNCCWLVQGSSASFLPLASGYFAGAWRARRLLFNFFHLEIHTPSPPCLILFSLSCRRPQSIPSKDRCGAALDLSLSLHPRDLH